MNKFVILLSLFFLPLFAAKASALIVKKLDMNKNGKIDRTEYYQGKALVKVEMDNNNDGKIDEKIEYSKDKIFEINYFDTNFRGQFNKKITFEYSEKHPEKILKKTYIDKDYDSKFEIEFMDFIDKEQHRDSETCSYNSIEEQLDILSKQSFLISAKMEDGFLSTDFGYKIDQACIEKWGKSFVADLKDTAKQGMSCLETLSKKSKTDLISGSTKNKFLLEKLIQTNNIKIVCSEKDFQWEGLAGHASTGDSTDLITSPKAKHPFISINPNDPEGGVINQDIKDELKKTLFHEGLHNLGHRHGTGIEYAYTCETCCFPESGDSFDAESISCKLCQGEYTGESDKNYVEDLISWSHEVYNEVLGTKSAINFAKQNPKSIDAILLLAKSQTTNFNPIGAELANILSKKELLVEPDQLIQATIFESYKVYDNEDQTKASKAIAEALYYSYYEGNSEKSAEVLIQNKVVLQKIYLKSENDKKDFRTIDIYKTLDVLLFDNWVNGYPNTSAEVSTKLYELDLFIKGE